MREDRIFFALIELVDLKPKDLFFKIDAITNAKGYLEDGLSLSVSIGEIIRVERASIERLMEETLGKDWKSKKDIIETKISIVEKERYINQVKSCELGIDNYGIKKVKYLFNAPWISNNLFVQPTKQIIKQLERHNLIPIDFSANTMFDEIKQVNGVIYSAMQDSSELKTYSIEEDYRFIPITSKKDEYCITDKAFRDIKTTAKEGNSVELWGRKELREWLCTNLLKTKNEKGLLDSLVQELDSSVAENENLFEYRLQRCKSVFKENYFSQQDVNFFQKKMRQDDLEKAWKQMLREAKNEIEKSLEAERQGKIAEVDKAVETYREAAIFSRVEEQEKKLDEINLKISEKTELLANITDFILSKTDELTKLNSSLQTKTLEIMNLNEQNIWIQE